MCLSNCPFVIQSIKMICSQRWDLIQLITFTASPWTCSGAITFYFIYGRCMAVNTVAYSHCFMDSMSNIRNQRPDKVFMGKINEV